MPPVIINTQWVSRVDSNGTQHWYNILTGATAYTLGNINTGTMINGAPLVMDMPGAPSQIGMADGSIQGVALGNNVYMMGAVPAPGFFQSIAYVQPDAVDQKGYPGTWQKTYDGDGGKYWVNTATGQVSNVDPFK